MSLSAGLCGDRQVAMMALVALVLQNVLLAVVTRYARLSQEGDKHWVSTTVVCCSEVSKLAISAALMYSEKAAEGAPMFSGEGMSGRSWALMAIPGLLYCAQNNLYIIGVSNLSVSLFQVFSQMKILTTAFFSVTILRKQLGGDKWLSLVALTVGVMLIVSNGDTATQGNMLIGMFSVGASCCTSGLAGVFLEMMLKNYSATVWERNLQMAAYGLVFGTIAVVCNDFEAVSNNGFFAGYNSAVVLIIAFQAGGGLIVAMVLKYADNLVKCFAVALSVVLGCVTSRLVYGEGPPLGDPNFLGGTILVCGSTIVYSMGIEAIYSRLALPSPTSDATKGGDVQLTPLQLGAPESDTVDLEQEGENAA
mmetsp:Transcript_59310/g.109631  ORF Transcript_59310/g.109631 Transcript_59310/m.109631 type:complete len:364 (-) Transcript_59310:102-1193(-)